MFEMLEKLEPRQLRSSGVTTSVNGDSLTVNGGSDANLIVVIEHNHDVWVNNPSPDLSDPTTADFHGVNHIAISAQAQSDQIFYTGDTVGAVISGGGGSDSITIDDTGTGSTYANGNGGDDSLTVIHSHNTTVVGGGGADSFYLNTASDNTAANVVYAAGDGGSDTYTVYSGTAILDADKQDTVIDLS